jgi:polysaccharide pyruvyl transferase WcaK-like protein
MKCLTIEIHGTGTHNRGAELMAIATSDRMRSAFPDCRLVVPNRFGPFEARARYGFFTTGDSLQGFRNKLLARFAWPSLERASGILKAEAVDVVLDASGFAFSDQWGPERASRLLNKMNTPKRRHQPLILLPQALGPFTDPVVLRTTKSLFDRASLVFARDQASYEAASALIDKSKLRLFPDFTVGVSPRLPSDSALPEQFTAIIPNIHMLDMTKSAEEYLRFLCHAVKELQARNLNPHFVLHDAREDRQVIKAVEDRGHSIPVLQDPDPRVLKGILGKADFVIGSRFHGLVSSLSQGVPCIGAGWSHKYPELFKDFDCADLLVADLGNVAILDALLASLADPNNRKERRSRVLEAARRIKTRTGEMWTEVETLIQTRARP